jgi:hypothetical protein
MMGDALRAVMRYAIREAPLMEVKPELLAPNKLEGICCVRHPSHSAHPGVRRPACCGSPRFFCA